MGVELVDVGGFPIAAGAGVEVVVEFGFAGARLSVDLHPATMRLVPDVIVLGDDSKPVGPGQVGRTGPGGHVPLGY